MSLTRSKQRNNECVKTGKCYSDVRIELINGTDKPFVSLLLLEICKIRQEPSEITLHPDMHISGFFSILHFCTTQVHLLITLRAVLFVIHSFGPVGRGFQALSLSIIQSK